MTLWRTVHALLVVLLATPAAGAAPGDLDPAFGVRGVVTTPFGESADFARAVALQPDGKIIAAGTGLARYNTDGSLDSSFGAGGKVATASGSVYAGALQLDGKIVTAGEGLQRYNSDGSLDQSFGAGGQATIESGLALALTFQLDGEIVVGGESGSDFLVARYDTDGSPDLSFGTGGEVTTAIGTSYGRVQAVAVQSDGKIIAAGWADDRFFALARYNANGTLDVTFGTGGRVLTTDFSPPFSRDYAYAVALQPDGKIVAAGYSEDSNERDYFALARYNANGSLDQTFGTGGKVTTAIGASDVVFAVMRQPDGKIVAAGTSYDAKTGNEDFALARYNLNGSLDQSFGIGGKVTTAFQPTPYSIAYAVALQGDAKIVAAGYTNHYIGNFDFALARYTPDGSLDGSFGNAGTVTTNIDIQDASANAVALQADGRIIAAGGTYGNFALARYNANGSLDQTFGTGGKVTTAIGAYPTASAVALQPDGKIVAVGSSVDINEDFFFFALARYNPDGSLDQTFGTGGTVTTYFGAHSDAAAYAVALQPDGKIVAAGYANDGNDNNFVVARYNANGSLDGSFGTGGIVTSANGSALVLQPDGRIVTVGSVLARYNPNGSLDQSFGTGGTVTTASGRALALQPDGKIVALGGTFVLTRYNANGSLDGSFGTGGTATTPIAVDSFANAVVLQPDGKIVVAGGVVDDQFKYSFVVARYRAANLLKNGGFEAGTTGWAGWGRDETVVSDVHLAGTKALRFLDSHLSTRSIYQEVSVTGGLPYTLSASIKTSSIDPGQSAYMRAQWRSASGMVFGEEIVNRVDVDSDWQFKVSNLTAPAAATRLRVYLELLLSPSNDGAAWFDEVWVERGTGNVAATTTTTTRPPATTTSTTRPATTSTTTTSTTRPPTTTTSTTRLATTSTTTTTPGGSTTTTTLLFGNTTIGTTLGAMTADRKRVSLFTLPQAGRVTKLVAYFSNTSGQPQVLRGVLYANSAGAPGALVGQTLEVTLPGTLAPQWVNLQFAAPITLAPGPYWLGTHSGATSQAATMYTGSGASLRTLSPADTYTDGASNPFGTVAGTGVGPLSEYAVVTPGP